MLLFIHDSINLIVDQSDGHLCDEMGRMLTICPSQRPQDKATHLAITLAYEENTTAVTTTAIQSKIIWGQNHCASANGSNRKSDRDDLKRRGTAAIDIGRSPAFGGSKMNVGKGRFPMSAAHPTFQQAQEAVPYNTTSSHRNSCKDWIDSSSSATLLQSRSSPSHQISILSQSEQVVSQGDEYRTAGDEALSRGRSSSSERRIGSDSDSSNKSLSMTALEEEESSTAWKTK